MLFQVSDGGDLYELAKIIGHANMKMTERYTKLWRTHITKTGNTRIWIRPYTRRQRTRR
jgi:site-specific recombinase XerD